MHFRTVFTILDELATLKRTYVYNIQECTRLELLSKLRLKNDQSLDCIEITSCKHILSNYSGFCFQCRVWSFSTIISKNDYYHIKLIHMADAHYDFLKTIWKLPNLEEIKGFNINTLKSFITLFKAKRLRFNIHVKRELFNPSYIKSIIFIL